MVNFGLLIAEICWRVWGTPATFNGFRVFAALLHGQTLRRWTEGATYIRQGGHQVGHWPTFLVNDIHNYRQLKMHRMGQCPTWWPWRHVREILLLNNVFPIVDTWLNCEDTARRSSRWCPDGDLWPFLGPAFPVSRAQHISDLHSKFSLGPHHVSSKYGRHSLLPLRLGEEKEEEERNHRQKYNGLPYYIGRP